MTRLRLRGFELALAIASCCLLLANVSLLVYSSDDTGASARDELVASAELRVPALLEFDSANLEGEVAKAAGNTTPEYREDYEAVFRQAAGAVPAGTAYTNDVVVERVAVVDSAATSGTVLVIVRQTATVGGAEQEAKLGRLEVTFRKVKSDWLIDGVRTV